MNIAVYLGANYGNDSIYEEKLKELGAWIGNNNHTLVYGGSKSGLMGVIAESVLTNGGKAIGVEPEFFMSRALQYDGLTELIVTKNMSERKNKMIELASAFITFPGGTGTLEEVSEVMSRLSLDNLNCPCIIYNLNGYYDSLKTLLEVMVEKGFTTQERLKNVYFLNNLEEIKNIINAYIENNINF